VSGALAQTGDLRAADAHAGEGRSWLARRATALRVAVSVGALALCPAVFYAAAFALTRKDIGFDLRYAYLPAARDVLHGLSPYASSGAQSLLDQTAYVYPPLLAMVVSPLTLLSTTTASLLGAGTFLLLVPAVLWLLDVRDWRCYGIALLWAPVFNAIDNVNVSLVLALAVAVAWRYRDRPLVTGLGLGLGVALKVFAWPLLVWPLVTGRLRAGLSSVVVALVAVILPWATVGFRGLSAYPALLRHLSALEQDNSYSLHAVVAGFGASAVLARVVVVSVAVALLVTAALFGRRGADLASFTCAIAAALVISPIVWQHYLVLLLVPLAVARPRLSPAWFLPLLLWTCNLRGDNGSLWQTVLVPAVAAALAVSCVRAVSPRRLELRG
jgi:alpha-1,2-mannosyltransferase